MNGRDRTARRESVARALTHHESTRAITLVSPPSPERSKWRIIIPTHDDPLELTDREAWILCLGIAAGQKPRPS